MTLITGLFKIKIYSYLLGPEGFGLISQLINLNIFINFLCTLGIPIGLIRLISEWESEGKWDYINSILKNIFFLLVIVSITLFIFTFIFSSQISNVLYSDNSYSSLIVLFSFSIPLTIIFSLFDSYVRGIKKFNIYVKVSVISSISTTLISIFLVSKYGVEGVALSFVFTSILPIIFYSIYLTKSKLLQFKNIFATHYVDHRNSYKLIFGLGVGSLIIGLADYSSIIFVRSFIIKELGLQDNGIYQVIYSISTNYLGVFFLVASVYTLPILSEIKSNELFNAEINNFLRIVVIVVTPIIIILFSFRGFIVQILFSKEFYDSTKYFTFYFVGDYAKLVGTVLGLWLVPRHKVKALCSINFVYNISFVVIFYFLLKSNWGLYSAVIGYMMASIFFFAANYFYFNKRNKFSFNKINLRTLVCSVSVILVVMVIATFYEIVGFYVAIIGIIAFMSLTITKKEFLEMKQVLKNV